MKKKRFLFFVIILNITFQNLFFTFLTFCKLNTKEQEILEKHKITDHEKQLFDKIFNSLDQEVLDLFDGKNQLNSVQELIDLLKKHNFTIWKASVQFRYHRSPDAKLPVYSMILTHPKVTNYFIKIESHKEYPKTNLSRIIFADRINEIIDDPQYNITTVEKTEKKLYHRPGKPEDLNDFNYAVLSKKVYGIRADQVFALPQEVKDTMNREISVIISLLHPENLKNKVFTTKADDYIITPQGKIAFIDTEMRDHEQFEILYKILSDEGFDWTTTVTAKFDIKVLE